MVPKAPPSVSTRVAAQSSTATRVALAALVDALGRGDPRARCDPHDRTDDGLDDVAPVRIHVEDQAAAAGAIIPARPLARPLAAVEHPPAELEPEADDAPERAARVSAASFANARQMDLVLDRAVLEPARLRPARSKASPCAAVGATGFSE